MKIFVSIPFVFLFLLQCTAPKEDDVFVFSYFKGNGEDGLHLAWSEDGYSWNALNTNQPFLRPGLSKDKLMRDPCIISGPDGKFHMVWTVSWHERGIGYAWSEDLIHWSEQVYIPVMEHEPGAKNCWAPDLFYDEKSSQYVIFWSTTIEGRFTETAKKAEEDWNHRIYYTRTRDFKEFTETELFLDPGFNVIDATITKAGDRFLMVVKDETKFPRAQKNLHFAFSNTLTQFENFSGSISDNWVEGPTITRIDDVWVIYFDRYRDHRMGAIASDDLKNWKDISEKVSFPEGTRHGTVFKVSKSVLDHLLTPSEKEKQVLESQSPAPKPLFRDPVSDGAADPAIIWNNAERKWFMFYTNRRANTDDLSGVTWVHGTKIGIAQSEDGKNWEYRGVCNIGYGEEDFSYWAPDVIEHNNFYHMYLTVVPGTFENWNHPRDIIHLTSKNLIDWNYESSLELASDKCIDASVLRMQDGTWRMFYNNEKDRKSIYYAESPDLFNWKDSGQKLVSDQGGEGPKVINWKGRYWMFVDNWDGLGIYFSDDLLNWERQEENILKLPGKGLDDRVKGQHPDVLVNDGNAYIFYFTHPGRIPENQNLDNSETRRSSIQVAELTYTNGLIQCDRDKPVYIKLKAPPSRD